MFTSAAILRLAICAAHYTLTEEEILAVVRVARTADLRNPITVAAIEAAMTVIIAQRTEQRVA